MSAAAAFRIGEEQATRLSAGALHRDFGHLRNPARAIAEAANSNERAARNWYDGKNLPSFLYAMRLHTKAPTFRAFMEFLTEARDGRAAAIVQELSALDELGASPDEQLTLFANKWVRP